MIVHWLKRRRRLRLSVDRQVRGPYLAYRQRAVSAQREGS